MDSERKESVENELVEEEADEVELVEEEGEEEENHENEETQQDSDEISQVWTFFTNNTGKFTWAWLETTTSQLANG